MDARAPQAVKGWCSRRAGCMRAPECGGVKCSYWREANPVYAPGEEAAPDPFGGEFDILNNLKEINRERSGAYGVPEDNFGRIARHWQVYFLNAKGLDVEITPTDVALLMDLMKTARLENMPSHRDSWVDKAGYARCGAAIEANLARLGRKTS